MFIFYLNTFIYDSKEITKLNAFKSRNKELDLIPFYILLEQTLENFIEEFKMEFNTEKLYKNNFAVLDFNTFIHEAEFNSISIIKNSNITTSSYYYKEEPIEKINQYLNKKFYYHFIGLYSNRNYILMSPARNSMLRTILNTVLRNHFWNSDSSQLEQIDLTIEHPEILDFIKIKR